MEKLPTINDFKSDFSTFGFHPSGYSPKSIIGEARRFGEYPKLIVEHARRSREISLNGDYNLKPMNDRAFYLNSPAAISIVDNKIFTEDRYASKTNNRKLKIKDTFTNILPGYVHKKNSCFVKPISHSVHPNHGDYQEWK